MAALWKTNFLNVAKSNSSRVLPVLARALSVSPVTQVNGGEGWLSKLLMVRKIEPGKDSHSRLLSDTETVYELQIQNVKPGRLQPYLKNYEQWRNQVEGVCQNTKLVGSWTVEIGDQDQVCHIWKHTEGYPNASASLELYRKDPSLAKLDDERLKLLRSRENQIMLAFSFWGHPQPRDNDLKFEMRSYVLKPGTMIEWGNNWARGISYRKSNAIAGFFSQIGQLYMVHHIWGYTDLQMRKDVREEAWRKPGWDECVAYTVPLIREMRSRWMSPNSFSPIK